MKLLMVLGTLAMAYSQSKAVMVNLDTANWTHDKESDWVLLHNDPATKATEMLVRFPGGHVIPSHWHDSNEQIMVLDGQLTLKQDQSDTVLNAGGYAYLTTAAMVLSGVLSDSGSANWLSARLDSPMGR